MQICRCVIEFGSCLGVIANVAQMVTIEVQLKEGDEQPEQHLDEGEHIERRVVPLDQLYEKLQGMSSAPSPVVRFANGDRTVQGGGKDCGCQVRTPLLTSFEYTLTHTGSSTGLLASTGLASSISRTNVGTSQSGTRKVTLQTNTLHSWLTAGIMGESSPLCRSHSKQRCSSHQQTGGKRSGPSPMKFHILSKCTHFDTPAHHAANAEQIMLFQSQSYIVIPALQLSSQPPTWTGPINRARLPPFSS